METLISIITLVIGLAVGYYFGVRRDVKAKKREITTQYLIDAYRVLANEVSHRPPTYERKIILENLLSDIQLFGTSEQVKLAKQLALDISSGETFELDQLINSLRDNLRKELILSEVEGNIRWLRFNDKSDNSNP